MQIENSFRVASPPDEVFTFLLDVHQVVGCVPGAVLTEVVDEDTFRGKVRIKVGPVTVAYNGTATIESRDQEARQATLRAEGRETTGSGSARASVRMGVAPDGDGSAVHFATDFTVVGRVAQFGRGIMEDVSRRLVAQMAECVQTKLEGARNDGGGEAAAQAAPSAADDDASSSVDAVRLARAVAADRLRRTPPAGVAWAAIGLLAALLFVLRLRRRSP